LVGFAGQDARMLERFLLDSLEPDFGLAHGLLGARSHFLDLIAGLRGGRTQQVFRIADDSSKVVDQLIGGDSVGHGEFTPVRNVG
jgi:hypothetical protein